MEFAEEFREAEHQALIDNTAQDVFNVLTDLNNQASLHASRWIWELVQNARDAAEKTAATKISVALTDDRLIFRHNGAPFNKDQVAHLIRHGSTKFRVEGQVGRFGTGFLSTHIISKSLTVTGLLDDGQSFSFLLDRTGSSPNELKKSMNRSSDAFIDSVGKPTSRINYSTEYSYPVEPEVRDIVLQGIQSLSHLAPYVLTFNPQIEVIEIGNNGQNQTFRRGPSKKATSSCSIIPIWITTDDKRIASYRVLMANDDAVSVAVLAERRYPGIEVRFGSNVPRFFVAFPLFGTETFSFPGIINSASFRPKPDRDGLYLAKESAEDNQINKGLIEQACPLLRETLRYCASHRWTGIDLLCRIGEAVTSRGIDEQWLRTLVRSALVEPLRDEPLVIVLNNALATPRSSWLPVSEAGVSSSALWELVFELSESDTKLVRKESENAWEENLRGWAAALGISAEKMVEALTLKKISEIVEGLGSVELLRQALRHEIDPTEWLDNLLGLLHQSNQFSVLDQHALLPDQRGLLRKRKELELDGGIDVELKEIADSLEISLRSRLLHEGIQNQEVRKLLGTKTQKDAITELLSRIRAESTKSESSNRFRSSNTSLFAWFLRRGMFESLSTFPVLTQEPHVPGQPTHVTQLLGRDDDSGPILLAPPECWPEGARKYANLFPHRHVLSSDYFKACSETSKWQDAARKNIVRLSPVFEKSEFVEIFLLDDELVEEYDHRSSELQNVTDIAFLKGEDSALIDAARKSRVKSILLFRFLLDHVISQDSGWHETIEVACECEKTHKYRKSLWIEPLKTNRWIFVGGRAERITASSLARLLEGEPELVALCAEGRGPMFLEILGVSAGDFLIQSVTTDEQTRVSLSRSLVEMFQAVGRDSKQIRDLAQEISSHPETILELQKRQYSRERVRRNQKVGKAVEEAFEKAFSGGHGLAVRREPFGSDYAVERENDFLDEDGREIVLDVGEFLVEIKATVTDHVRMTAVQAKKASDTGSRYILCVVALSSSDEDIEVDTIKTKARFVIDIGRRVMPLVEGLTSLEASKQSLLTGDGQINLEIEGETVRCRVDHSVWEKGISFEEVVRHMGGR